MLTWQLPNMAIHIITKGTPLPMLLWQHFWTNIVTLHQRVDRTVLIADETP